MSLHSTVAEHAPSLKHLIGVIPDDELAERAIQELADTLFSEDENERAVLDAVDDARKEGRDAAVASVREEIYHILNDVEQLAKMISDLAEDL